MESSSIIGMRFIHVLYGITNVPTAETIMGYMKKKTTFEYEGTLDSNQWIEANGYPNEEGMIILMRDITIRKQLEQQLQEKTKEQDNFIKSVVGRELKMIELKMENQKLKSGT